MIDKSNEIFNSVATKLRETLEDITIIGEYVDTPSKFPCVTIDETSNIATNLDSAIQNKYASIQYRVQVFSNLASGKRVQAREIYNIVDGHMQELGFVQFSYSVTPTIYNSNIYQITAIYSGVIDDNGTIYRK